MRRAEWIIREAAAQGLAYAAALLMALGTIAMLGSITLSDPWVLPSQTMPDGGSKPSSSE